MFSFLNLDPMLAIDLVLELVIFGSYCILSVIVFQLYLKNAKNVKSCQVTAVVILTAMFLMFCAFTHVAKLWGGQGSRPLTFVCAAVSSATAVVTINLRTNVDEMLTKRFRAVKIVKDEAIVDLMKVYHLNVQVVNRTIVAGTIHGVPIPNPMPCSEDIASGKIIHVSGAMYRIMHKISSKIDLDRDIERDNNNNNSNSFAVFGIDVTEEHKNQELVKQTNRKQLALCLSTAHEIRTPLTSVMFLSKNVQNSNSDELAAHLEMLKLVAANMMEAGRFLGGYTLIPTPSNMDTREVFERMSKLSRYMHSHDVQCEFHVDDSVPQLVISDVEWFWHMFLNFILASLKHTSTGYVKSKCSATERSGITYLTLSVADSGIGIANEDPSQLFEMFANSQNADQDNKGVGLYTVKKKVEILKGFCSAVANTDPSVQGGSVFQATFPVSDIRDGERPRVLTSGTSHLKKILVVDDISTVIAVMQRALQDHHVDVAYNGKDALGLMLQQEYDIVFMDLSMPIMGGLEATMIFREKELFLNRENKQVIVMMSATEIDRPDIFDRKLPKPIDHNVLKSLVC